MPDLTYYAKVQIEQPEKVRQALDAAPDSPFDFDAPRTNFPTLAAYLIAWAPWIAECGGEPWAVLRHNGIEVPKV